MNKEKLIKQIMAEAEADGEPVTREEAEEMAEMEIKAKGIKNYTQGEKPKKKPIVKKQKIGRNDPCPCGSGKKYKKCCGMNE